MVDPEDRVPLVRALVLQPEDPAPDLAQQRGPVDLLLEVVDVQLLHRPRHRPQRRDVLAHGHRVELPQPAVVRHQARRARRGGIEVVLEVQVGPAEVVDGRHAAVRILLALRAHAGWDAASSEWSPRDAVPVSPSATTAFPIIAPSSRTRVSRASRPTMAFRIRLSATRVPCSSDTLGPISLRSMVTPSSM